MIFFLVYEAKHHQKSSQTLPYSPLCAGLFNNKDHGQLHRFNSELEDQQVVPPT